MSAILSTLPRQGKGKKSSNEALRATGNPQRIMTEMSISSPLLFPLMRRWGKVKLIREQVEREASGGDSDS